MTSCKDVIITTLRQPFDTWTILDIDHIGVISPINTDRLLGVLESVSLRFTVKNQQNKFKYAPRIEPNNYKYVSYFRPVAI